MAWLHAWSELLRDGFEEFVCASCQFNSVHKKEFRFVAYLLNAEELDMKCPGGHEHVRSYTKPSAVYTWELSDHLAAGFEKALRSVRRLRDEEPDVHGYESPVVNDLLAASSWKHEKCWPWRRKSHINVLEGHAGLAVLATVAETTRDARFVGLMDSRVAKGALAKGRSALRAFQLGCRRSAALQIAYGLFAGWCFAPTRLNTADDPTRRVKIREAAKRSFLLYFSAPDLQLIHASQLERFAANWIRLVLLLASTNQSLPSIPRLLWPCSSPAWIGFGFFLAGFILHVA